LSEVARALRAGRLGSLSVAYAPLRSRLPPIALAYAIPSLVAAIAVQTWFRSDATLASGDLSPPVVPDTDYRAHWNQFDTGVGAPSYQIVWLPYFEGLRLFAWLGLGEGAFQRVWLTLLVAGAAAAVVFLARSLVAPPIAVAVAGFLATFNAYRLTTTFDSLPLLALIAAGVLGGLVVRAGSERPPRPLVFALASTICAFVFLNPPHLALVLAWIASAALLAVAVNGRAALRRVVRFLATAAPLAVLFNLWWIVPAALAIASPVFEARFAAADVQEWAWTHVRGSLGNVVALTSSWAWGRAEYFPFSLTLERFPFTVLQFLPAAAALLGLVLARGRQRAAALVLLALGAAAIWAMKGVHEPLAATNSWLYEHAPGFWLLREPTKVGFVLVLVYALLTALGIARILELSRPLGQVVAALVVVGAGVYAYPFLTGSVVPTDRPQLPSARVRIPDGWRDAARYLDSRAAPGKVVVLPRLDYYQAPTTWGYYGTTFLHQLIPRPVIDAPLPGGYYRDAVVPELLTQLERRILAHGGGAATLVQALGARFVLLRRDLRTDLPGRSFAAPDLLAEQLRKRADLRLLRSFGVADLYEAKNIGGPEVSVATPLVGGPSDDAAAVHGAVDMGTSAVYVHANARPRLAGVQTGSTRMLPAAGRGPRPFVARVDAWQVRLQVGDGRGTHRSHVALRAPERPFRLLVGSRSFDVERTQTLRASVATAATSPRRGFREPVPIPLTHKRARRVGDCHKYDPRGLRDVGITARRTGRGEHATLRLTAREHSACIAVWIGGTRGAGALRFRLSYRTVRGNPARLCFWQDGPDRCARSPALASSPGWHRIDAVVRLATGVRSLRLFLYADGDGTGPTTTEYRSLAVARPVPTVGVAVLPIAQLPDVSYRRLSPSAFRVSIRRAREPFLLVLAETFAPGWRVTRRDGDSATAAHLRVNGYANGWVIPRTGSYELTIEYRPERLARFARRLDLVAIPLGLLALIWWPRARSRRGPSTPLPRGTT
jgi:arabinofuranan 3-O-arabinosyltransferase